MIGTQKFKSGSRDPDPVHFEAVCHPQGWPTSTQNLRTVDSTAPEVWTPKMQKQRWLQVIQNVLIWCT